MKSKIENNKIKKVNRNNSMELQKTIYTCFHCQKPFKVNYNRGIGMPSQKNFWLYWVDENWDYKQMRRKSDSEWGEKICDKSLKKICSGSIFPFFPSNSIGIWKGIFGIGVVVKGIITTLLPKVFCQLLLITTQGRVL